MTTLYLASIADAISNTSISGVTVKDKDQVAASWESAPDVLYPNPENWISNFTPVYDVTGNLETAAYTMNYRLLTTLVGDFATFPAAISDLVDKISLVLGALVDVINPYSANVEMKISGVSTGPKEDPAGNMYHGADISLAIEETH